jgi:hypothetical protein
MTVSRVPGHLRSFVTVFRLRSVACAGVADRPRRLTTRTCRAHARHRLRGHRSHDVGREVVAIKPFATSAASGSQEDDMAPQPSGLGGAGGGDDRSQRPLRRRRRQPCPAGLDGLLERCATICGRAAENTRLPLRARCRTSHTGSRRCSQVVWRPAAPVHVDAAQEAMKVVAAVVLPVLAMMRRQRNEHGGLVPAPCTPAHSMR